MLPWKSIIELEKTADCPIYLQIANAISLEIKKGHLGPGVKLPGTRQLSEMLDVHRITVVRAYEELDAQGWIEMRPSRGSYTSSKLPEINPRRLNGHQRPHSFATATGYTVPVNGVIKDPATPNRHITGFHDGPDPRLIPVDEIAKAFRSVLLKKVNLKYTSYVEVAGVTRFRNILSNYLNDTRGLQTSFENVLITRGSTMGLYLLTSVLFEKGDAIIVPEPNYYYADRTFMNAGMDLLRVPVDEDYLDAIADAFGAVIDAKSPYTGGHSNRVGSYATALGQTLGFSGSALRNLRRAAVLHDVGKLGVSSRILEKPDKLDDEEWVEMRGHASHTIAILSRIGPLRDMAGIAGAHHERLDGKGYPLGLEASRIAPEARIISVADFYDALTADRPYRGAMPVEKALAIMEGEVGKAIDGTCFEALRELVS